jgi:hypothetical protein
LRHVAEGDPRQARAGLRTPPKVGQVRVSNQGDGVYLLASGSDDGVFTVLVLSPNDAMAVNIGYTEEAGDTFLSKQWIHMGTRALEG